MAYISSGLGCASDVLILLLFIFYFRCYLLFILLKILMHSLKFTIGHLIGLAFIVFILICYSKLLGDFANILGPRSAWVLARTVFKVLPYLVNGRRRRSVGREGADMFLCYIQQVPGRHPHDPAFKLEVS